MSKYFDIKNIGKGPWFGAIKLHLSTPASGFEKVVLPAGGTLENIPEERITDHVRQLMKQKRERPPVIELVEVDYDARMDARKKERELYILRAKKLKAAANESPVAAPVEESGNKKKSKKKQQPEELSAEEQAALEAGKDLP